MDDKTRTLLHYGAQSYQTSYNPNWQTDSGLGNIFPGKSSPITSVQRTQSRGHGWGKPQPAITDVGGDFTTIATTEFKNHTPGVFDGAMWFGNKYVGPAWPIDPRNAIKWTQDLVTPSSELYLMQKGSTAISRCLPTNPVVDGATALGELKAGLPKLIGKELFKSKFKDYRKYGSEYVNFEFGIKPIISDVKGIATSVMDSEKILNQLYRDSGRNVRRKYTFPEEKSSEENSWDNQYCYLPGGNVLATQQYDGAGKLTARYETSIKTWFTGCFTYHMNLGTTLPDRVARSAAEARKLFGLELTPATLWNLAPWSWAVDWEGNIGDVLHNVGRFAQDGLVMRYGYIMQQKTVKATYTLTRGMPYQQGMTNGSLSLTVTSQSKVRRRATPFGFGFDMTALTGRQSAILGALGISRGPRHL